MKEKLLPVNNQVQFNKVNQMKYVPKRSNIKENLQDGKHTWKMKYNLGLIQLMSSVHQLKLKK